MFWTKIVERLETRILCSITFLKSVVYETMWKNVFERKRSQKTTWSTRIACSIPEVTNTHTHTHTRTQRLWNIHCFSIATI